jgi:hypothetical protein
VANASIRRRSETCSGVEVLAQVVGALLESSPLEADEPVAVAYFHRPPPDTREAVVSRNEERQAAERTRQRVVIGRDRLEEIATAIEEF